MDFQKLISSSFHYAIAGLACGVFYREFTKFNAFTGKTTLAFTHLHLLVMGTLLFLILAAIALHTDLAEQARFQQFRKVYVVALPFMAVMFFVRGILQVLQTPHFRHCGYFPYPYDSRAGAAVPGSAPLHTEKA